MPTLNIQAVIDGFNLYHSIRDAIEVVEKENEVNRRYGKPLSSVQMRWLDIHAVCRSYLSGIREKLHTEVALGDVHYFSALARHKGKDAVTKHQDYVGAIGVRGVTVHPLSRFKTKEYTCGDCNRIQRIPVEKETDVAVASKLIELAVTGACDAVFLISGDTDLLPALRTVRKLRPSTKIVVGFPYNRESGDIEKLSDAHFKLTTKTYRKWQMPDPVVLPNGQTISRPIGW